ncbi:MAG: HypC/HybG/HupF family hydrogenase formation chaperone [Gemmatimonadaceae bacterium]|nr:HypC/HybG/HupF family hydrogenase formation chaperone [Gemmatimonadaceae bacterium]MDQ3081945.1 HypC/HybG/HupF family hydrogenase formation chaperone [Gemmatimonadota bacterium]
MCLAIPGKIVEFVDGQPHLAVIEVSGVRRRVNIDLLREDGLALADWVLIHVGFAMSKISPEHAQEQIDLLTMLGEAGEAVRELEGYQFG